MLEIFNTDPNRVCSFGLILMDPCVPVIVPYHRAVSCVWGKRCQIKVVFGNGEWGECLGFWNSAQSNETRLGIGGGHSGVNTSKLSRAGMKEPPRHFPAGALHSEYLCSKSVFISPCHASP